MKTEFNLTGGVCVCVLADPSVPQEKFTRTDPTFTQSHTSHSRRHIEKRKRKKKRKREKPRLPLLSKSHDFIFRLFVTQINHQQTTAVQAGL